MCLEELWVDDRGKLVQIEKDTSRVDKLEEINNSSCGIVERVEGGKKLEDSRAILRGLL